MTLVLIGRLGRPHGVNGELALDSVSLDARELTGIRRFVWRNAAGETRPLTLRHARQANTRVLVTFDGVTDRVQAAALTLGELLADSAGLPDPGPRAAYTFELIGLTVATEDGRVLGSLADVLHTGAHPIYVVRGARELMIPATPETLKRVDLAGRRITVALTPGLEEL
jgi:16S rRNA processing protein RimM